MKINFSKLSGKIDDAIYNLAAYLAKRFPISDEKAEKTRRSIVRYGEFLYRRTKSKNKWIRRWHIGIVNSVENGQEAVEEMHKEYLKLESEK